MIKYLSAFLIGFILVQSVICQQISTINDYPYFYSSNEYYSRYLINPSYSGFNKQHEFNINSFGQWVGFSDALNSNSFSYDGWFEKIKSGIGFCANIESYGNLDKRHEISGFYSYRILKSSNYNIILGTKLGLASRKIANDIVLIDNKAILGSGNWVSSPILDFGIAFNYDKLNIGFAYKNLIESKIKFPNYETILYSKGFIFDASYVIKPNDKLIIEPRFIDYYYNSNSISLGIKSEFDDKYLFGLGYETYYKKIDVTVALRLFKYFQIGYVFEKYKDNAFHGLILKVIIKPSS
jgi:type IX secretion system PorP/SprF family membrane protein